MISNARILTVDDLGVFDLRGTINNTGEIMLQAPTMLSSLFMHPKPNS